MQPKLWINGAVRPFRYALALTSLLIITQKRTMFCLLNLSFTQPCAILIILTSVSLLDCWAFNWVKVYIVLSLFFFTCWQYSFHLRCLEINFWVDGLNFSPIITHWYLCKDHLSFFILYINTIWCCWYWYWLIVAVHNIEDFSVGHVFDFQLMLSSFWPDKSTIIFKENTSTM